MFWNLDQQTVRHQLSQRPGQTLHKNRVSCTASHALGYVDVINFPVHLFFARMETFQECAVQMLREFRALLQHSPLPVNQMRLLQLLALNMFAVSNTQLKGRSPLANLSAFFVVPRIACCPSRCSADCWWQGRLFGSPKEVPGLQVVRTETAPQELRADDTQSSDVKKEGR